MIAVWFIVAAIAGIVSGCARPCYTMVGVVKPTGDIVLFDACRGRMTTIPAPLPPAQNFDEDDEDTPPPRKDPA